MADLTPYPKRIARILKKWHVGAVTPRDCVACSSSCCSHSGFALIENVLKIYDLYRRCELKREDYEFPPGLSFSDFVRMHFDVLWVPTGNRFWNKLIAVFFPKSLSGDGHLLSIPWVGGSYYKTRAALFTENSWLNKGCVFLNKKNDEWPSDDKDGSRQCILHHPDSSGHLTQKPIDCVFYVCTTTCECKVPTRRFSRRWFRALAASYPRSVERFLSLVEKDEEKEDGSAGASNGGCS